MPVEGEESRDYIVKTIQSKAELRALKLLSNSNIGENLLMYDESKLVVQKFHGQEFGYWKDDLLTTLGHSSDDGISHFHELAPQLAEALKTLTLPEYFIQEVTAEIPKLLTNIKNKDEFSHNSPSI